MQISGTKLRTFHDFAYRSCQWIQQSLYDIANFERKKHAIFLPVSFCRVLSSQMFANVNEAVVHYGVDQTGYQVENVLKFFQFILKKKLSNFVNEQKTIRTFWVASFCLFRARIICLLCWFFHKYQLDQRNI